MNLYKVFYWHEAYPVRWVTKRGEAVYKSFMEGHCVRWLRDGGMCDRGAGTYCTLSDRVTVS